MKKTPQSIIIENMLLEAEAEAHHREYQKEMVVYNMVKNGQVSDLLEDTSSLRDAGLGTLSNNAVRNFQYHFTICAAICARLCIEAGMNLETSYTLSDYYIKKADALTDVDSIVALHKQLLLDYASRMRVRKPHKSYSTNVKKAFEYINSHIHKELSVDILSNALHINKTYLCTVFKKETGMTIGAYIEQHRVELACTLLSSTELSYTDIYQSLCFHSQSYFTKIFKKNTNMTPSEYRSKYYSKNFKEDE